MKTSMVFVSMPWIMSMPTFSKLLQIISKLNMVLIKVKIKPLNTCLSWKHGLTMTHTTMKTLKVPNCQWMTLCTWHWYIHSCVQLVTVQELNHLFQIVSMTVLKVVKTLNAWPTTPLFVLTIQRYNQSLVKSSKMKSTLNQQGIPSRLMK